MKNRRLFIERRKRRQTRQGIIFDISTRREDVGRESGVAPVESV